MQKGFTPILIIVIIGVLSAIVFGYLFLASPHKAIGNPVKPFKAGGYFLSEKISYLFRSPEVGDRVTFVPSDISSNDFLGIITKIENKDNIKTYTIISGGDKPWLITQDKITSRIYFPLVSKGGISSILESISNSQQVAASPTPQPIPTPSLSSEISSLPIYPNAKLIEKVIMEPGDNPYCEPGNTSDGCMYVTSKYSLTTPDNWQKVNEWYKNSSGWKFSGGAGAEGSSTATYTKDSLVIQVDITELPSEGNTEIVLSVPKKTE